MQAEAAVAGRLRARGIGAQVGAALVLGHAHADQRRGLLLRRTEAAVVVARKNPRQPFLPQSRAHGAASAPSRRSSRSGNRRRFRSAQACRCRQRARHARRACGSAHGLECRPALSAIVEQFVPGRMELDLVEAMAVAVERRSCGVNLLASKPSWIVSGLPSVAPSAVSSPPPSPRPRADRLAQHGIAGKQIIRFKRRRLVLDLEHRRRSPANDLAHCTSLNQGNNATCSRPIGFGPAHDQVHVLDGLAGGAFHQIVERRNNDGAARGCGPWQRR